MFPRVLILVLLAPFCFAQPSSLDDRSAFSFIREEPERVMHVLGMYLRYIPKDDVCGMVVLVHGSIGENESAADAFVNAIVDTTREALPDLPEQLVLYGHSAGGQFVSRYVVMHAERVSAAVISAAGTFAYPNPDLAWTNGMKPLRRRIRWSDDEMWKEVEIVPDPQGWAAAAQVPITIVVGSRDTVALHAVPGNPGRLRMERARAWVEAMKKFARMHGRTPRIRYVEVANVGHNSAFLTPTCQQMLLERVAESRDGSDKENRTDTRP